MKVINLTIRKRKYGYDIINCGTKDVCKFEKQEDMLRRLIAVLNYHKITNIKQAEGDGK